MVALLTQEWRALDELVRIPAVPRRTVEELLAVLGDDVEQRGDRWRLAPARAEAYRARFALDALPALDQAAALTSHTDLLDRVRSDVAAVPPPLAALDHVQATPESVLRRALWLAENYDLDGARLLLLGDHDLTSLAACAVAPGLSVTVVDLDERVLEFVDRIARERGYDIRCLHADLRFGLPPAATEWADLVFSDPPYTPEGMGLFAARGLSALREPELGRLALVYGYSDRAPALGLKVQQELQRLGLVFEAVLPAFDRYQGAQAVGSASSLYVCQPTARSRKLAERPQVAIYTHGPQSVEGAGAAGERARAELVRIAAAAEHRVEGVRGPGWDKPLTVPAGQALAVDASADPGPWLLRTLLASNARRVAVLVGNSHPDLANEQGQHALAAPLAAKFRLRYLRSTPEPKSAVVVAEEVPVESLAPADRVVRHLLDRAHGKIGNIWREALVAASGGALTKNAARDRIAAASEAAGLRAHELAVRLVDLPRHRLGAALAAVRDSQAG
ncbi:Protein of unknown function DUF43 [Streptoalloteichus hindustanus]|uniref:N(4)-bis(aminopropyl)spermidine synthase C-terminal domain-containing protein n=1 Tax=Streptoalloteichus hindustanus TaxID=2017 RepID=A0A1M5JX35_STRHI|nr:Protein of unknown function DUF43 [Streptoalloteichus hindustanus]